MKPSREFNRSYEGMNIEVIQADYANPKHSKEIPELLDAYASDPMGGGKPLEAKVKENLVAELGKLSHAFTVMAYIDGTPVGLANCFEGFSTFACKPLVNVHDIVVLKAFRGHGVSQALLRKVEDIAKAKGCCKMTLEVLSKNEVAKGAYRKFGFSSYELDPQAGTALFWQKSISE